MTTALRPRTLVLFLGDIVFFAGALWLSLFLRSFDAPSKQLFIDHLVPFSLLFLAWLLVFFVAGLYESRSIILERRAISITLLISQIVNIIIAALFFFFIPIFGIAPKTLLVIYLVVSFLLVLLWRVALFPLSAQKRELAVVVGEGAEIEELTEALKAAPHAPTCIVSVIRPGEGSVVQAIRQAVQEHRPRFIIADFNNPLVVAAFPELYNYLAEGIRFIDALSLYEDVFGRVPLSILNDRWLAQNISLQSHALYDVFKRFMDIAIALPAAILSLVTYPFVMLARWAEGRGPMFAPMDRVGEGNKIFKMFKFSSMTGNDSGNYDAGGASKLEVTKVGKVLRVSRLDELPQLWNVLKGDLSFVGPRPEVPSLVKVYEQEIPYYGVRHLIKPGVTGWAQLYGEHGHHGVDLGTTKNKLSYDLYYLKHRSLPLDITIALKTIKKLLTRSGV